MAAKAKRGTKSSSKWLLRMLFFATTTHAARLGKLHQGALRTPHKTSSYIWKARKTFSCFLLTQQGIATSCTNTWGHTKLQLDFARLVGISGVLGLCFTMYQAVCSWLMHLYRANSKIDICPYWCDLNKA